MKRTHSRGEKHLTEAEANVAIARAKAYASRGTRITMREVGVAPPACLECGCKAAPIPPEPPQPDFWKWYGILSLLYYRADIRNWGTPGMATKEECHRIIGEFEAFCKANFR